MNLMNPKAAVIVTFFSVLSLSLSLLHYEGPAIGALVAFGIYVTWAVLLQDWIGA